MHAHQGRVGGILLAGGESRRMGRDKAALRLGARTLAELAHAALSAVCAELVVVTWDGADAPLAGARIIGDHHPGRGPLEGVASGLEALGTERAIVLACDMPFATPALLAHLASLAPGAEAVVPVTADGPQPLLAVYARRTWPALRALLDGGERRMGAWLATLDVAWVEATALAPYDPDGRAFWNLNRPEDLAAAQAVWAGEIRNSDE